MEEFSNRIQSTISKSLVIFLSVMLVVSLAFMIIIPFFYERVGLAVTVIGYLLSGPFFIIALIILLDSTCNYVRIEGKEMTKRFFFSKKTIKVKDISWVKDTEGYYDIFVGTEKFTSINKSDPATQKMLYAIERMTNPKVTPTPYVETNPYTYEEEQEFLEKEKRQKEEKARREEEKNNRDNLKRKQKNEKK